ncbi:MAG: membrane integrity-associated transporter subunit PqiC [Rhodospirillales bacterium]|nr:membrane integrity-associated transporter subunit PqiC [Rhodospirillales bacterium]
MRALSLLLLGFILAACAQPDIPNDQYYRLSAKAAVSVASAARSGVIEVDRFAADGVTGERALVYSRSDSPNVLRQYHYHYWVEAPPRLIQEQVLAALREAKLAGSVVTPELRANADYRLKGRIRRFEQVLAGGTATASVEIETALVSLRDGKVVALATYREEDRAADESPAAAVAAFDRALARLFGRLIGDLARLP